jgi:lipopolysaccharide transport system ATP-binding protein
VSDIAIHVENLSKQYRIGGPQASYKTIRESLVEAVRAPFRRLSSVVRGQSSTVSNETIWALKDVSFEVERGEVVGIIGRNGAGKTTLLKVLSRITEPTEGYAEIHGRVGSLLEVGTGFHPELTGRENIYLNGAILGMKRAEIDRKFGEIVAFAEIEKFIDTPVKHYSSGMYVRLAFAVAAHLEPEILLVDEVLAVGDAAFQKKCLGKMGDVAREGRTVLFVSHDMGAIQNLCPRAFLLESGSIFMDGEANGVIRHYLHSIESSLDRRRSLSDIPRSDGHGTSLRFTDCKILNDNGTETRTLQMGEPISVLIGAIALERLSRVSFVVGIENHKGVRITTAASEETGDLYSYEKGKEIELVARFDDLILNVGKYSVTLSARILRSGLDLVRYATSFEVVDARHSHARHMVDLWGDVRCTPIWEYRCDERSLD